MPQLSFCSIFIGPYVETTREVAVSDTLTAMSSTDLLTAVLKADPYFACSTDAYKSARKSSAVRQAIATELIQPRIEFDSLIVDFDDPIHQDLTKYHYVHPALRAEHFFVGRRGRQEIIVAQIWPGYAMCTAHQCELIRLLGLCRPCVAAASTTLHVPLRKVKPVMAHCGQEFKVGDKKSAVGGLLHVSDGLILDACQWYQRWGQDYCFLAETPSAEAA